jgi:hypothetical protein
MKSAPSIVSPKAGRIDVVAQGNDNAVWHLYFDGGWSQWVSLGGIVTATPTCWWWDTKAFHVFARGTDNQVWHKYFDWFDKDGIGRWHNPLNRDDHAGWGNDVPAHPKGGIYSAPVAVGSGGGKIDIFARAANAEVWNMRWAPNWQTWKPILVNSVFYPAT